MPKSKRSKQVDLTKTKKHGFEGKVKLVEQIKKCVDEYAHIFIFSVNEMRNNKMKKVREQWKHSRFFIGKNKVMAIALGKSVETEYRPNLHKIAKKLIGERGLLFTNKNVDEVMSWFSSYSESDYPRSGHLATETINLLAGPLEQFPHSMEPYLRQLGLPTTLIKGIVNLTKDHEVCKVGDKLTPEQARIIKLLGHEMAEFYIKIECAWSQDGTFEDFQSPFDKEKESSEIEDMELTETNEGKSHEGTSRQSMKKRKTEETDSEKKQNGDCSKLQNSSEKDACNSDKKESQKGQEKNVNTSSEDLEAAGTSESSKVVDLTDDDGEEEEEEGQSDNGVENVLVHGSESGMLVELSDSPNSESESNEENETVGKKRKKENQATRSSKKSTKQSIVNVDDNEIDIISDKGLPPETRSHEVKIIDDDGSGNVSGKEVPEQSYHTNKSFERKSLTQQIDPNSSQESPVFRSLRNRPVKMSKKKKK